MIIRYVVLLSYIALLALAANAWRAGDEIEIRLPGREMMLESRKSVDRIASLQRATELLGISLEAHISLQDAMRAEIQRNRQFMGWAALLALPAVVYVVRTTGRNAREEKVPRSIS